MDFEGIVEDHFYSTQHAAFTKVASLLKLQKDDPKSFVQVLYELTCRRLVWFFPFFIIKNKRQYQDVILSIGLFYQKKKKNEIYCNRYIACVELYMPYPDLK